MTSSLIWGRYLVAGVAGRDDPVVVERGGLYQEGGVIREVGVYEDLVRKYSPDEVVGSPGHVVLPGFVNAHHHVGLTPFQLGAPDSPLELWNAARLAARDVDPYLDTLYSAFEMIRSGITTVHHLHTIRRPPPSTWPHEASRVLSAYRDIGMRVNYALMIRDQNRLVYESDERFLATLPAELAADLRQWIAGTAADVEWQLAEMFWRLFEEHGRNLGEHVRISLAPVNVLFCSDQALRAVEDCARRSGANVHIHLQTTPYEKLYAQRRFGKTGVGHLDDLGFLGPAVTLGHGVWLTENDVAVLAARGTSLCHNASSNLRIRSGIAPLNHFVEHGLRVALGLDEAGINDDRDMLQEMRLVLFLHRVPGLDDRVPTSAAVLRMATEHGAHTAGFATRVGRLEPGLGADAVLMRLDHIRSPYLDPAVPIVDAVVHRGRSADVDTVVIAGQVVLREGRFAHVDEAEALAALERSMKRPPTAAETHRRDLSRRLLPHVRGFYDDWHPAPGGAFYHLNQR